MGFRLHHAGDFLRLYDQGDLSHLRQVSCHQRTDRLPLGNAQPTYQASQIDQKASLRPSLMASSVAIVTKCCEL